MNYTEDLSDRYFDQIRYEETTYAELMLLAWQESMRRYVDWFVVHYYKLIAARCRRAVAILRLPIETWEDLASECVIQAYKSAESFDPSKGDIKKFLLSSLWNYMLRNTNRKRYAVGKMYINFFNSEDGRDKADERVEHLKRIAVMKEAYTHVFTITESSRVSSMTEILDRLDWHERMLLNLKLVLKMNNCQIAQCIGSVEGTVRYRIAKILEKLKISGDGSGLSATD